MHPNRPYLLSIALAALAVGLPGCADQWQATQYLLHVADGQSQILTGTEPVDDVLASGRLSADDETQLRLAVAARTFAIEQMSLTAGNSYTTFYDASGNPLAYNLSASRKDKLQPRTWWFPIMGELPYLAFFDEQWLTAIEADVAAEGFDTFTYELDAYSTLGLFDDPIRSPMLKRGTLSLSETIIHEILHNTVWRPDSTVFNESLATFVGRQGAIEFLTAHFGVDSGWDQVAADYYADVDVVNAFLNQLYTDLEAYYVQPIPSEDKVVGREAIYQAARDHFVNEIQPTLTYPDAFASYADLPTNNAWMLGHYRYNFDLDVFAAVYTAVNQDWPAAVAVYEAAASAPGDPFGYLRAWLANQPPSP